MKTNFKIGQSWKESSGPRLPSITSLNGTPPPDKNDNTMLQMKMNFKERKPFGIRKEEVASIRHKFPTKIPVIVERFAREPSLPYLDKTKFLVPQEITMSQFVTIIRNRLQLNPHQAFYLMVNNKSMASLSKTLAEVYRENRDDDGFLYITYASQEVFGGQKQAKARREEEENARQAKAKARREEARQAKAKARREEEEARHGKFWSWLQH